MAGSKIVWTPIGESGTENVDLTNLGLQRLAGGVETDAERTITPAGRAVVLFHDVWSTYEVHVDGIHRTDDAQAWLQLQSFLAHAGSGAEFTLQVDSAKTYSSTLSAGAARGATTLSVASATGLAAGDTVVIEHATDPRRQSTSISGPPAPTSFTISPALHHAQPAGSAVRHFQFLEHCRCRPGEIALAERDAGLGVHLWDFRMRFRTFRA